MRNPLIALLGLGLESAAMSARYDHPLRIGFLGAGLIATYHSKSLRRSGAENTYEVVRAGVFDPDTERATAFAAASGHRPCATEDEVLDTVEPNGTSLEVVEEPAWGGHEHVDPLA